MRHILAGIDFSSVSRDIVDAAADLAEAYQVPLTLVHVAAPDPDFVGYDAGPQAVRDTRARELRDERNMLHSMADDLRSRGLSVTPRLVHGPTVETLLAEAGQAQADLLVVGSHGRGALWTEVLGSVSTGVLRHAPCPVLVVPVPKDGR